MFLVLGFFWVAKKLFILKDSLVNFFGNISSKEFQLNCQMTQVVVYICFMRVGLIEKKISQWLKKDFNPL